MHFIMFEKRFSNEIYACLVNDAGLDLIQNYLMNRSYQLGFDSNPDLLEDLLSKIVKNIVVSIILESTQQHVCQGGYELVAWSSSKKGMGKILIMYILNQGITLVADRRMVSSQARDSIIKLANSAIGKLLKLAPLDNFENPVTVSKNDDCKTYTNTGGYIEADGIFKSKLDVMKRSDMTVEDYMDFAVYIPRFTNYPKTKVSQSQIDALPAVLENTLVDAITSHFKDIYLPTGPSASTNNTKNGKTR